MPEESIKILLIEDDPAYSRLIQKMLTRAAGTRCNLKTGDSLSNGLDQIRFSGTDVIILDLNLPDSRGLDTFFKVHSDVPATPIIVLTGHKDEKLALEAVGKGAQDYLVKGEVDGNLLLQAIRYGIERKKVEGALQKANGDLKDTIQKLNNANQKILEQKNVAIKEERLKVLLEMAGATAHKINQPLMALLGSIDLMKIHKDSPEKLERHMNNIAQAAQRISGIVKKIQGIHHYRTESYLDTDSIITFDQNPSFLLVTASNHNFNNLKNILQSMEHVNIFRSGKIAEAIPVLKEKDIDLILTDYALSDGCGLDFLQKMGKGQSEIPVIIITENEDENLGSRFIRAGAYGYISKPKISNESVHGTIKNALEKARLKMEIKLAKRKLADISFRDELTGLYNSKYFMETLDREIEMSKRYDIGLALYMIEINALGSIIENHGISVADSIINVVGGIINDSVRKSDLVCRYSNEKFAVIFLNLYRQMAHNVEERLRNNICKYYTVNESTKLKILVSMGIKFFDKTMDKSATEFIKHAEQALQLSKKNKSI